MTNLEKLAQFKAFCEREYKDTKRAIEKGWGESAEEIGLKGITRCLGAADFLQYLNVPFEEVDEIYLEYREKFYNEFILRRK